jgi:hypothetical protein
MFFFGFAKVLVWFFSRTAPAYNLPNLCIIFHEPTNVVIPKMSISQRQEFGLLGRGRKQKGQAQFTNLPFLEPFLAFERL